MKPLVNALLVVVGTALFVFGVGGLLATVTSAEAWKSSEAISGPIEFCLLMVVGGVFLLMKARFGPTLVSAMGLLLLFGFVMAVGFAIAAVTEQIDESQLNRRSLSVILA